METKPPKVVNKGRKCSKPGPYFFQLAKALLFDYRRDRTLRPVCALSFPFFLLYSHSFARFIPGNEIDRSFVTSPVNLLALGVYSGSCILFLSLTRFDGYQAVLYFVNKRVRREACAWRAWTFVSSSLWYHAKK